MPRLYLIEKSTKASKELIQVLKIPGTQTLSQSERKNYTPSIDWKIYLTPCNRRKTQTKVVPGEVPTIAPLRVPITVPPPRVPAIVTPPRVMTPRIPMISQEDPIEDSRKRDTV